ncbi:hypothetical protein HMPREF0742_01706 [Rothia aeria F0184]|uniref:dUTPase n=1 Tax=Rothia aeria F0184 TaxID=888019 RepID=U7V1Y3_9MICC|nr:hypothetical protein HMPREF0742_01706 [Rothia aeria F0184]
MLWNKQPTTKLRHSKTTRGRTHPAPPIKTERESLATDYDAPRKQDDEQNEESYEELNARRSEMQSGAVDEDENTAAESFELPGADLSNEELNVVVLPAQDDEFTCASCFLVRHRSQIAREEDGLVYCVECEG